MVAQLDILDGTVSRANGKGFMLQGREGWLNVSRYADPAPTIPPEGAKVRVSLDRSGFVRAVEPLDTAPPPATHAETAENGPVDRDTRIMRQAALNTATAILASGGRAVQLGDVLRAAAELEAWVTR